MISQLNGWVAQLVRASVLHAGCPGFESQSAQSSILLSVRHEIINHPNIRGKRGSFPGFRKPVIRRRMWPCESFKPAIPLLAAMLIVLVVAEPSAAEESSVKQKAVDYPQLSIGIDIDAGLKIDNQGEANHRFDNLGFSLDMNISKYSRAYAGIDFSDFLGYNALGNFGPDGWISGSPVYQDTEIFLESYVPGLHSTESVLNLKFRLGYGSAQELLTMDFTGYRFERSVSSGINGLDLGLTLGIGNRFFFTAAFNPSTLNASVSPYPDVFGAFSMQNDHTGSSWGSLIRFFSSSMQLFYDSSSDLESSGYYDKSFTAEAFSLGIGGNLSLDFAGIEILGFGMTEFLIMYDSSYPNIVQAEWGAGFLLPVFSSLVLNLSGSNAVLLSDSGEGSFMNFGLDSCAMFTEVFGVFAAAAAVGILDNPGASFEGGLRFDVGNFVFDTGYGYHSPGAESRFGRGAFDRTGRKDAPGLKSGFFINYAVSF